MSLICDIFAAKSFRSEEMLVAFWEVAALLAASTVAVVADGAAAAAGAGAALLLEPLTTLLHAVVLFARLFTKVVGLAAGLFFFGLRACGRWRLLAW